MSSRKLQRFLADSTSQLPKVENPTPTPSADLNVAGHEFAKTPTDVLETRIADQVVPLVRVSVLIIKLLAAVGVAGVAPIVDPNGMISPAPGRHSRAFARRTGRSHEPQQGFTLDFVR